MINRCKSDINRCKSGLYKFNIYDVCAHKMILCLCFGAHNTAVLAENDPSLTKDTTQNRKRFITQSF